MRKERSQHDRLHHIHARSRQCSLHTLFDLFDFLITRATVETQRHTTPIQLVTSVKYDRHLAFHQRVERLIVFNSPNDSVPVD